METKYLIIREAIFDDCKYFAKWEEKPDLTEFFTIDEDRNYEEVVTEFVRNNLDPSKLQFTITLKPDEVPIGKIFVTRMDKHSDSLDITRIYIGDKENRGKGYGEEALRRFLDYCFINLHMERVTLDHFMRNKVAANLYEKIGFQNEGIMRNAAKKDNRYYDLQLKSILRSEYYERIHEK